LSGRTTHALEPNAALRGVFLQSIEHAPQIIPGILRAASVEQGNRIDRGIITEPDIAGLGGEVHLLVEVHADARPLVRSFHVRFDIREKLIGEDRHGIPCAVVVQEREGLHLPRRDHQAVAAQEAENAHDQLEAAAVVVRVDKVNAGRQTAKTLRQGFAFVLLMRQRDHVLGELGLARLARLHLLRILHGPAVSSELVEVFPGRNELVPIRDVGGGSGGVEDGGEVDRVGFHVVDYRLG